MFRVTEALPGTYLGRGATFDVEQPAKMSKTGRNLSAVGHPAAKNNRERRQRRQRESKVDLHAVAADLRLSPRAIPAERRSLRCDYNPATQFASGLEFPCPSRAMDALIDPDRQPGGLVEN